MVRASIGIGKNKHDGTQIDGKKTVAIMRTFKRPVYRFPDVVAKMGEILGEVVAKAKAEGVLAGSIIIEVENVDREKRSKVSNLDRPSNDQTTLYERGVSVIKELLPIDPCRMMQVKFG